MKPTTIPALLAASFLAFAPTSRCDVADLATIMAAAEKASNELVGTRTEERVAEKAVSLAEGGYFPRLEADAVDTSGFPGSSGGLGIHGLVGSSYRSGYGVGLVADATLWDFGRTSAEVRQAEHLSAAQKAQTTLTRYDVDTSAAQLFFDCVRDQSQLDAWSFVVSQAQVVATEVNRFVKTGQRSIVERFLSRSQLEEAQTNQKDFEERTALARKRLQVLTRLPLRRLQCPSIDLVALPRNAAAPAGENPLLVRASEKIQAAKARVDRVRADFMPKLKAFAGVGALENTRVVPKEDYAVGVGITLPLFDGFETLNGLDQSRAQEAAQESYRAAALDRIDAVNARYDQIVESSHVRVEHLLGELALAHQGFTVAKSRYFSMQGTLVDLREALRNLMRTRSETINAKAEYELARTENNIFNGRLAITQANSP